MRLLLLILLFSFFATLQCSKSNYFFVTRRDTKEAICIRPSSSDEAYSVFPTFDLDKLQIPRDVGFKYWDWLGDWQLQNDKDVRKGRDASVLFARNQPFHFMAHDYGGGANVAILASNITLWMRDEKRPRGAGLLFELDHLNKTTKLKDTTLKICKRNPLRKKAKCTIVDYKNGTNFLNDGNRWTAFVIFTKENRTGVEMFVTSYVKAKTVGQCIWNNANISNPFTSDDFFDLFAKSHQRNAALYTRGYSPDLDNNKEMKRKYATRSSGKLCFQVRWDEWKSSYDSNELMEVKNLASGRVQPPTNTTHDGQETYFQWKHLDAGEYEITLRFGKRRPSWKIDLCNDDGSNIERTWLSIPTATSKCQFRVGESSEFSAGPSSPDPTIKPIWSLEAWEHVCDRLGIGSNDTEVQIKFCNFYGCNFSKCPHLQDEPSNIFDFATENITP